MSKKKTSLDQHSRVAIVGGGVSACFLAHLIAETSGAEVSIFEKGRGLGGRCSVRHAEDGSSFTHGAQFFTIKNSELWPYVKALIRAGSVEPLAGKTAFCQIPGEIKNSFEIDRFHGTPYMNSFLKVWASRAKIFKEFKVTRLSNHRGIWNLHCENGHMQPQDFSHCVLSTPIIQGQEMWSTHSSIELPNIQTSPCWALLFSMKPMIQEWERCFVRNQVIAWVSREQNSSNRKLENWVAHANGDWSMQHIESDEATVVKALLPELETFWERSLEIEGITAHRWRYASIGKPQISTSFYYEPEKKLAYIGDWFCGGRIEGAMQSAFDLNNKISVET